MPDRQRRIVHDAAMSLAFCTISPSLMSNASRRPRKGARTSVISNGVLRKRQHLLGRRLSVALGLCDPIPRWTRPVQSALGHLVRIHVAARSALLRHGEVAIGAWSVSKRAIPVRPSDRPFATNTSFDLAGKSRRDRGVAVGQGLTFGHETPVPIMLC